MKIWATILILLMLASSVIAENMQSNCDTDLGVVVNGVNASFQGGGNYSVAGIMQVRIGECIQYQTSNLTDTLNFINNTLWSCGGQRCDLAWNTTYSNLTNTTNNLTSCYANLSIKTNDSTLYYNRYNNCTQNYSSCNGKDCRTAWNESVGQYNSMKTERDSANSNLNSCNNGQNCKSQYDACSSTVSQKDGTITSLTSERDSLKSIVDNKSNCQNCSAIIDEYKGVVNETISDIKGQCEDNIAKVESTAVYAGAFGVLMFILAAIVIVSNVISLNKLKKLDKQTPKPQQAKQQQQTPQKPQQPNNPFSFGGK